MPEYSLREVIRTTGGRPDGEVHGTVREILTDSRRVVRPDGALFVALRGPRHDGHRFIGTLYRQGIHFFMVDHLPEERERYRDALFIIVDDTLQALQRLAVMHRSHYHHPLVGITGSNGKTVVKEWLVQALAGKKTVVRSPGSYNSQVGVPLSLWLLDDSYDLAVIEAGISRPGEMQHLEEMIRPAVGILTNIGEAHQEHFRDLKHKLREKLILFKGAEVLVCRREGWIDEEVKAFFGEKAPRFFTWGATGDADLQVKSVVRSAGQTHITALCCGEEQQVAIPFTDEASFENAMHVWAAMQVLGCERDHIPRALKELRPVAMRMEIKKGMRDTLLINDYYNSDLQSLSVALDYLRQQDYHGRRTVVLSDILQSGRPAGELYREVARRITDHGVNRFIGIGPEISSHAALFPEGSLFYPGTEAFLEALPTLEFHEEVILLKGARDFRFERISRLLEEQVHQTVLEVDLDALVHNLNVYRSLLHSGTRIMAMVKAFAYGSGAVEVARALEYQQVDYLAVAYADEGVVLRQAGIRLPVVVMNPEISAFDQMLRYSLEPEIYSAAMLDAFLEALEVSGIKDYPVHIKIDTGMHRLGFLPEETEALTERLLQRGRSLYVRSVFSHLAASEDPRHDAFTQQQITLFRRVAEEIEQALGYPVLKHILNSAGIERFPEAQFDMVRPGLGLYGLSATLEGHLHNVSTFRSVVTQVKRVMPGESVGYGRAFTAEKETEVAVVPVGYADGLKRNLSDGKGALWINGRKVPILGKICMDMCMADVTGMGVQAGDAVEVFGEHIPITEVARLSGTIPYEILASIPARVKRIYVKEG